MLAPVEHKLPHARGTNRRQNSSAASTKTSAAPADTSPFGLPVLLAVGAAPRGRPITWWDAPLISGGGKRDNVVTFSRWSLQVDSASHAPGVARSHRISIVITRLDNLAISPGQTHILGDPPVAREVQKPGAVPARVWVGSDAWSS